MEVLHRVPNFLHIYLPNPFYDIIVVKSIDGLFIPVLVAVHPCFLVRGCKYFVSRIQDYSFKSLVI